MVGVEVPLQPIRRLESGQEGGRHSSPHLPVSNYARYPCVPTSHGSRLVGTVENRLGNGQKQAASLPSEKQSRSCGVARTWFLQRGCWIHPRDSLVYTAGSLDRAIFKSVPRTPGRGRAVGGNSLLDEGRYERAAEPQMRT